MKNPSVSSLTIRRPSALKKQTPISSIRSSNKIPGPFSTNMRLKSIEHIGLNLGAVDLSTEPLITDLTKYTQEELLEYRAVFNMFDADRSGAIGLDELEKAVRDLGLDPTVEDLKKIIEEVDKRGNQQIDFDEFCEFMGKLSHKQKSWNDFIKECFQAFDVSESGGITKKDFHYIMKEFGGIQDHQLIDSIFKEYDIDGDRVLDYDEFVFLCKNYLTEEDIA
uniref:EF-hand domain-containing protein n=1 Tax=Strongyloides stercoralis TaxID=6248 RepID=A0AAF5HZI2_STRER